MKIWRRRLQRWLFWSVSGALIVAAVLVGVIQLALPWWASDPDRVARLLSSRLGSPVRIESTEPGWSRRGPVIALHGVRLGDGDSALRIGRAAWAVDFAGLLLPGGRFFMREGHPMLWAIAEARPDGLLSVEYPYFETDGVALGETGTYVDTTDDLGFAWTIEFNHGLSEIMNALIDAGMEISGFVEHDSAPWVALEGQMEPIGGGEFRLSDRPERLPHTYTLQARKL